ncbi:bifunctional diguanylate cyclase/phosphodiesterase [Shewanella maritima]|uniref:Bifunctional diguanylate cyclase/phosphodiesterase n=1 Tax=Shewanella maritima TaxID=2520507 RepID=A0A411PFL6_9GAMM|nr:bifunctional diguanylate cyclase/phosphodiesterase [Shewanella maritima]QBF82180.1 bifunctional diguanylate cyclase/phosphodiesterase [Shewanella maritima]
MFDAMIALLEQSLPLLLACVLSVIVIAFVWNAFKQFRLLKYLTESFDTPHQALDLSTVPRLLKPLVAIIERYHLSEQAQSERDKLTNLINRVGIKRILTQKLPLASGCLMLVDIRQFRFINDLWGFNVGDQLLIAFSRRLSELPQQADYIARMNGNEFLLYFEHGLSQGQISDTLRRLELAYQLAIEVDLGISSNADQTAKPVQKVELTLQAGVLSLKQHGADISLTLRRLDLALQKAKRNKLKFAFYEQNEDKRHQRQLILSSGLAKALANDELFLVFQPKLNCHQGYIDQVEALVRWQHPEFGVIYPNEFLHLAEKTGLMSSISLWVINQVVKQQAAWQQLDINLMVALNLSATDITNTQLVDSLALSLQKHGVSADRISIEVTESAMMASLSCAIRVLNQLRELGLSLAIDDFGTGQSSLAYLRHLPVNEVKLDRAFMSDIESDDIAKQIVKTTVKLAHQLQCTVTVEGIETPSSLNYVQSLNVDYVQGLLISEPMAAAQIEKHHLLTNSFAAEQSKYPFVNQRSAC